MIKKRRARSHAKRRRANIFETATGNPGAPPVFETFINCLRFSEDQFEEWTHIQPADLAGLASRGPQPGVTWLDVEGLGSSADLATLAQYLELHSLTTDDITNCDLRPQFQSYPGYYFFALKMIYLAPAAGAQTSDSPQTFVSEQISFVLKDQTLATFQEKPGDNFGRIRERLRAKFGKIRSRGADHLLYALLDTVVEGYLEVVDQMAAKIEAVEDQMRETPLSSQLTQIYEIKRDILWLRKNIVPVRDLLNKVQLEPGVFQTNTRLYLRDLTDHVTQVTDSLSLSLEMISVLLDTWHSLNNQKMNAIMKTLTMFSTVFLPLNFIAGVYGMNFKHMPELDFPSAYPAILAIMFMVAAGIVAFFIQKGWLWEREK